MAREAGVQLLPTQPDQLVSRGPVPVLEDQKRALCSEFLRLVPVEELVRVPMPLLLRLDLKPVVGIEEDEGLRLARGEHLVEVSSPGLKGIKQGGRLESGAGERAAFDIG